MGKTKTIIPPEEILWGYTQMDVVDICWKAPFPGANAWPANHPIWDCWVPGHPSPRAAWNDLEYLRQAVHNMFWILKKDMSNGHEPDFVIKHKEAFLAAQRGEKLLLQRLVLVRFTVAKYAPKVTAIRPTEVLRIVKETGIDLSSGVYCPMAGFGGIIEAGKQWLAAHNIDWHNRIEAYDINPKFVEWYHYDGVRDMLAQKVETDKTVICCPPFGDTYEHWDGTPDEMSDISFMDWYRLIHEYIKAPAYIIIGPELRVNSKTKSPNGFEYNGLFKRKSGVQWWSEELYQAALDGLVEPENKNFR